MELNNQNSYLKEHILKCPICYESFSNIHKPLIIPCGHTICSLCMENLKKISAEDYEEDYTSEINDDEFDLSLDSENEEDNVEQIERSEDEASDGRTSENEEESEEESEDNYLNEIVVENLSAPEIVLENLIEANREIINGNTELISEPVEKEKFNDSNKKKIKIKCSICRKKMKIFESEILLNLNVLKIIDHINAKEQSLNKKENEISQNGTIYLQVTKEKTETEDLRIFCKLCRFIDTHDSHLTREGSENHKEYLIYLDKEVFAKLKNLFSNSSEIKQNNLKSFDDCNIEDDKILATEKANNKNESISKLEKIFFNGVNELIITALTLFFENLMKSEEFENFGKTYIKNYFMINSKAGYLKNKSFFKLTKLYENFRQIIDEFDKQEETSTEKKLLQKANNCIEAGETLCDKYIKTLEQYLNNYGKLGITNNLADKEYAENLQSSLNSYSNLVDRAIQLKVLKLFDEEFLGSYWNNLLENERRYALSTDNQGHKIILYDLRIETELEIHFEKIFKDLKAERTLTETELTRLYTETIEVDEDGRYLFLIGKRLTPSKSFRVYDLLLRQLENRKKLPMKFYAADKYFFKNKLFIFGGNTGIENFTNNCYYYDVEADWWEQLPSLNLERGNKSITVHENKFYVFGGTSDAEPEHLLTFELLDLNKMGTDQNNFKWEAFKIKNLNTPIHSMHYGFIAKNYLVIFGGEESYSNEENTKGYLIHMSEDEAERKVVEEFKIKIGSTINQYSCSTLRGLIVGFSSDHGSFTKFNIRNNLVKLKNIVYN